MRQTQQHDLTVLIAYSRISIRVWWFVFGLCGTIHLGQNEANKK